MPSQIQVDYEQLDQVAALCAQEAQSMAELYMKINEGVDQLRGGWGGDAANKFFGEMDSFVLPNLKKIYDAFDNAQSQIKTISQKFAEAEQEASGKLKTSF
jgi:WXG100 family type VII secretion target